MASIQSLGVGSGLLTSDLVEDIISAEREATDLRLESRRAEIDAKISAFGGIRSTLEQLQSASAAISNSDEFLSNLVASSNPGAVGATATAQADPGIYSVEVQALARSHTLTSLQYEGLDSVVGEGTLTFQFGTTTFSGASYDSFEANESSVAQTVTIDETNNTLAGVRDAINDAQIGVAASIVNDGNGFVLVLKSEATGISEGMEITVAETGDAGLSALAFNAGASAAGVNLTQSVAADDAIVSVDGITVQRSTNKIEEVIPGVTLNAIALNAGVPATLTVSQDTEQIQAGVQTFVDAFNDVKALADELSDFDDDAGQGALLTGDSTLRGIQRQLQRFLSRNIEDLESGSLRSLVDLGFETDQDSSFFLSLDSARFAEQLSSDPTAVQALLTDATRAADGLIEFTNFSSSTTAGNYDVSVTQLATKGFAQGSTAAGLASPITIDADNSTLSVTVDGVASAVLQLEQKVYADGDELAAEVQNRINADTALAEAGRRVEVSFDATDNALKIESDRYGGRSSVGITLVGADSAADLGLDVTDAETNPGVDVAGTINGAQARGSGQFLSLGIGPAAATSGRLVGTAIDELPLVVAGGDNELTLSVDGAISNTIEIPAGSYASGAELASAIESAINADSVFSADGASVAVAFDPTNERLTITSGSTGTLSTVDLLSVSAGLETVSGLSVATGTTGAAAGRNDDPAGGIQLRIRGGETGDRGTVTLVRGVMNRLSEFLSDTLSSNGSLTAKLDGLSERISDLEQEAVDFDERMDLLESRLRFQFASADALISQLNNTSQFLDQQLSSLPSFSSDE